MSSNLNGSFLGVTEAARAIGITTSRLRQMLRAKLVRGEKVGPRAWLVSKKEVERLRKNPSKRGRPRSNAA